MNLMQPSPASDQSTDDDLVDRTLSGERETFGVLWNRHHQRVYGYGVRRLNNREQAEVAMGETFRRAHIGVIERSGLCGRTRRRNGWGANHGTTIDPCVDC